MGRLKPLPEALQARPVPANAADFEAQRARYKKGLAELRRSYGAEWSDRARRESAAQAAHAAAAKASKGAHDAARAAKREAALAAQSAAQTERRTARTARRDAKTAGETERVAEVAARRTLWLAALEKDAARWIAEDQIDAAITPSLFALKHAWQVRPHAWAGAWAGAEVSVAPRTHLHRPTVLTPRPPPPLSPSPTPSPAV